MLCPRCEQGHIVQAKIIANGTAVFVCQECEATWFSVKEIGISSFIDFGTYMQSLGLKPLWSELQVGH